MYNIELYNLLRAMSFSPFCGGSLIPVRCLKAWQCLKNLHHGNDQVGMEIDTFSYADTNYCYAIMSTLFHNLFPKDTLGGVPALAYVTHGHNSSGVSLLHHVSPTGHCVSRSVLALAWVTHGCSL